MMVSYILSISEYVLPFLLVLTVLVFIHELGHYLVARWNGVKIEVFSIGFGPELFGWTDKAQTRWKFSLIPLGGYVKMYGDADASSKPNEEAAASMTAEQKSLTLQGKTVGQRIAVVVAGPAANYILAIVLLSVLHLTKGIPTFLPTVGGVAEGSIAHSIGIAPGDHIIAFNDQSVANFDELRQTIPSSAGQAIKVQVKRTEKDTSQIKELTLMGNMTKDDKPVSSLGITPSGEQVYRESGIIESFTTSIKYCYVVSTETLKALGQMVIGNRSSNELGGILTIGALAKQSAAQGWIALILLTTVLSINLGLINLLPIPVLDGGHIVFYSIEALRGKPVSAKAQERAYTIGLFIVLTLMAVATWNDLSRFRIISWITGLFS
jgi:regulator of sigma E protease